MVAVLWKPAEEKPANPVAKPAATKPVPTGAVGNTAASNPTEKMTGNAGGDKPAVGGLRFEEVAQKAGAGFSHARAQFDPKAKPLMPWLTAGGAGVAVGDFDRDGLDDIYVVTSLKDAPNALFRNKGNFQFEDVAAKLGLADVNKAATGTSAHAVWFDYDGDGWLDLLLLRFGQLSLYHSIEGRAFEDRAKESGLARLLNSMSAAAFDYDRDGDLDLYIDEHYSDMLKD